MTAELELAFIADEPLELEVRSAPGDERVIEIRIVPWGVIGRTAAGPERFVRGAFDGTDPATVSIEAIGPHGMEPGVRLAGRAEWLEARDDGEYAGFRVSRTRDGDELLELARDLVYRHASVVFAPITGGTRVVNGVIERTRVALARVGLVDRPAYVGADVIAVRSASDMTTEPIPDPTPDPTPDPVPDPEPPASLEAFRRDMAARFTALEARGLAPAQSSPLAQYATLDEYAGAVYTGQADAHLLARALVDQITTDNPGVMTGGLAGEVRGIVDIGRAGITALGGSVPLDDSGMTLDWPVVDPALDLDTLIAEQVAEKTEIHSVKVKILTDGTPIKSYAGGSDLSYQLIRRSRPAYREAYLRLMTLGYARTTEAAFEAALEAKGTGTIVVETGATADQLKGAFFAASAEVEDATGAPASVVLASPAEWLRIGALPGLYPPAYGTSNVPGTAQASTLRINVSGLEVVRAPYLTAGVIITNGLAARWAEDGPLYASAEDVAKLGQNNAVWGMGAAAIYVPAGIVKSSLVAGDEAARSSRK